MNDASKFAKDRLHEASRAKDHSRQIALGLGLAAVAGVILLGVAMLDYWFVLPAAPRMAGMAILALLIGAGTLKLWRIWRRPTTLKEAALDAEAQSPRLGCELSTAAEYLSGERKVTQEYEAELAAALQAKAAANLERVQVPYWQKPIQPALLLGGVAFAVVLFGVLASGAATALKRAALPWSKAAYTHVEVKPGDMEVPVGRDLEVKSVFSGRVPHDAKFAWQDEGNSQWQFASLTRNDQGEYVYPVKNVRTPVKYRVSGSDAVSPDFTVQPYVPPEVKDWQVALAYPEYTRLKGTVQSSPEISVIRGTTASFEMTPTTPLAKARLRFEGLPAVDLQPDEKGVWKGSLKVTKDTDFWIELADAKGHTGGNEAPFHVKALPDNAPKVEIDEPGKDLRAEATNTVPVKISVTDDFGVNEVRLVYHRLGGPEQVFTAKRNGETNSVVTTEIPLSSLGLKEYELVAYHAEATDNNTLDGPGISKSDVYFIEITNEEGGECKCQAKGQKVNLLVIQKQIIADTTALAANAPAEKFTDLAKRQKDAIGFGRIYLAGMTASGAAAAPEMEAAVRDMEQAQALLEKSQRAAALPPEESALARLYQIISKMPELNNFPTVPPVAEKKDDQPQNPMLKVVLEAIKKKKKEQPDNKELETALQEAKRLDQEQASLSIGVQNSANGAGQGEAQIDRSGKEAGKGKGKGQNASKEAKNGEGKKNDGEGKEGEGSGKDGKGNPKDSQQMAEKQNELSKEAAALAEMLAKLAGKDARVGHGAGKKVAEASGKMKSAAEAMRSGDMQTAGTKGAEGEAALQSAIGLLERILKDRPDLADVSKEEFPKQYEAAISEYFKKLSYAE